MRVLPFSISFRFAKFSILELPADVLTVCLFARLHARVNIKRNLLINILKENYKEFAAAWQRTLFPHTDGMWTARNQVQRVCCPPYTISFEIFSFKWFTENICLSLSSIKTSLSKLNHKKLKQHTFSKESLIIGLLLTRRS